VVGDGRDDDQISCGKDRTVGGVLAARQRRLDRVGRGRQFVARSAPVVALMSSAVVAGPQLAMMRSCGSFDSVRSREME
jgi:hypothetical protein